MCMFDEEGNFIKGGKCDGCGKCGDVIDEEIVEDDEYWDRLEE